MTYAGGGQTDPNIVYSAQGVAVISEREETRAVARWVINREYPAVTAPSGHRWQGYYTPEQPPRTLYYKFE